MTEHDFALRFRYPTNDDKFDWLLVSVKGTMPSLTETIRRLVADVIKRYPEASLERLTMTYGGVQD